MLYEKDLDTIEWFYHDDLRDDVRVNIDALLTDIRELREALVELTPQGSEYHDSPRNCLRFIRERMATTGHIAKERNDYRDILRAAYTAIDALLPHELAGQEALLQRMAGALGIAREAE